LLVVLAIIAVLVAFPVRIRFAEGEFVRLQRRRVQVDELNQAHAFAMHGIELMATTDDSAVVTEARQAVSQEHARRLERIRSAIQGERTPDKALRRLRATMLNATRHDLDDLRHDRWIASTAAGRLRAADTLIDEQKQRWHRTDDPEVKYPDFRATTEPAVKKLIRYLDEPTGSRLVGVKNGNFIDIDVDRNNVLDKHFDEFSSQGPNGQTNDMLARDGYLVLATGGGVFTIGTGLDQPPRFVSDSADTVFLANRPDAFWVANIFSGTDVSGSSVRLLDRDGQVLAGPLDTAAPIPGVWDEATGRVVTPAAPVDGPELARNGDNLAYMFFENNNSAHLVLGSFSRRPLRDIANPLRLVPTELCRFSPDGRTLACLYEFDQRNFGGSAQPQAFRLGLIDVATGAVTVIDGSAGLEPIADMQWSSAGDRVFVASGSPHPIATYRLGDSKVRPLRYIGPEPERFVALPAAS
jgi:hypothetical protein